MEKLDWGLGCVCGRRRTLPVRLWMSAAGIVLVYWECACVVSDVGALWSLLVMDVVVVGVLVVVFVFMVVVSARHVEQVSYGCGYEGYYQEGYACP